ncbi:MAG: hypothetical protein ACYDHH_22300 [Solirubrobacteraceae bacterium]
MPVKRRLKKITRSSASVSNTGRARFVTRLRAKINNSGRCSSHAMGRCHLEGCCADRPAAFGISSCRTCGNVDLHASDLQVGLHINDTLEVRWRCRTRRGGRPRYVALDLKGYSAEQAVLLKRRIV